MMISYFGRFAKNNYKEWYRIKKRLSILIRTLNQWMDQKVKLLLCKKVSITGTIHLTDHASIRILPKDNSIVSLQCVPKKLPDKKW